MPIRIRSMYAGQVATQITVCPVIIIQCELSAVTLTGIMAGKKVAEKLFFGHSALRNVSLSSCPFQAARTRYTFALQLDD